MATQLKPKMECSEAEWQARLDLAACYRIFDHMGWSESIYNHISVGVPGEEEAFLINPSDKFDVVIPVYRRVLLQRPGDVWQPQVEVIRGVRHAIGSIVKGACLELLKTLWECGTADPSHPRVRSDLQTMDIVIYGDRVQ